MTRNPRPPSPQLVFGSGQFLGCYAWCIEHAGLKVLGDTKAECLSNWHDAYQFEYFYDEWVAAK